MRVCPRAVTVNLPVRLPDAAPDSDCRDGSRTVHRALSRICINMSTCPRAVTAKLPVRLPDAAPESHCRHAAGRCTVLAVGHALTCLRVHEPSRQLSRSGCRMQHRILTVETAAGRYTVLSVGHALICLGVHEPSRHIYRSCWRMQHRIPTVETAAGRCTLLSVGHALTRQRRRTFNS
jgi:hypothetical protein